MLRVLIVVLLATCYVFATDRLDIVDSLMNAGAAQQFKREWQKTYEPIREKILESNAPSRFKNAFDNKFANIGNDEKLAREIVKLQVQIMTEGMNDAEVEEFARQLKNPVLQKTNELLILKKINKKINTSNRSDIEKFTSELRSRMSPKAYKTYVDDVFSATNMKALDNTYKAVADGTYAQDVFLVIKNMVFGNRLIIEMKDKDTKYYKNKI